MTVQVRNLRATGLAAFSAMVLYLLGADGREEADANGEADQKFDELVELCSDRISLLKALMEAWKQFCAGLGISDVDVDGMVVMPFASGLRQLDVIQDIVGDIPNSEDYRREWPDHMDQFWRMKIEDNHTA